LSLILLLVQRSDLLLLLSVLLLLLLLLGQALWLFLVVVVLFLLLLMLLLLLLLLLLFKVSCTLRILVDQSSRFGRSLGLPECRHVCLVFGIALIDLFLKRLRRCLQCLYPLLLNRLQMHRLLLLPLLLQPIPSILLPLPRQLSLLRLLHLLKLRKKITLVWQEGLHIWPKFTQICVSST